MAKSNKNSEVHLLTRLSDLEKLALKKGRKKVAVAVAHDEHCLEAVCAVMKKGIIESILIGSEKKIKEIAASLKLNLKGATIVNEENEILAVKRAVKYVRDKEADILMKGNVASATFLKGVLDKEQGLRKSDVLCHLAFFEVPTYHKLIALTDAAMVIAPDLKTKIAMINNCVGFMNQLGYAKPKVAMLCAVEMVNEQMPATLEAALITKMNQRGQIKHCIIDGPLAYDNAVSAESAKHKGIVSEVAGDADLLVTPDIEAGNILYKCYGFSANAKLAAVILGATAPIVLTSRSDTEESKQSSIILAAAVN
jgi:phosphate butyryltransferase